MNMNSLNPLDLPLVRQLVATPDGAGGLLERGTFRTYLPFPTDKVSLVPRVPRSKHSDRVTVRLARVLTLFVLLVFSVLVSAQTPTAPSLLWHSDGWSNGTPVHTSFSGDGSAILIYNNSGFSVYNTSTDKLVARADIVRHSSNSSCTAACLSKDGSTVYYADYSQLVIFDVSTGNQTYPLSASGTVQAMCVSDDGSNLGFVTANNNAYIYNLSTAALSNNFAISMKGNTGSPTSMNFIDGGQEVVFDGPTIYNLTGSQINAISNSIVYPVVVSFDRNTLYTVSSNGNLTAYAASNLGVLWSVSIPAPHSVPAPSSDNQAVFIATQIAGYWTVYGYSLNNGTVLALLPYNLSVPTSSATDTPTIATSSQGNEALVGPGNQNEQVADLANLNTSIGGGTYVSQLFEGSSATRTYSVSSSNGSQFVADDLHDSGNKTALRGASTGSTTELAAGGLVISPDSLYYLENVNENINVDSVSTGQVLAYFPAGSGPGGFGWGASSSQFYVFENSVLNLESFDGTSISTVAKIGTSNWSDPLTYSSDGKYLAILNLNGSGIIQIFDTSTGKLTGTILPDINSNGIVRIDAAVSGQLGVYETISSPAHDNEYRVFNISSGVATQVGNTIKYVFPNSAYSSDGSISPDGRYITLMDSSDPTAPETRAQNAVRIYRASDGTLLQLWSPVPGDYWHASHMCFSSDSSVLSIESIQDVGSIFGFALPPTQLQMTLSPTTVTGGQGATSTGTLRFDSPVPVTTKVVLTSSSPGVAPVLTYVVIPAGSTSGTFTITPTAVTAITAVTITAVDANEPALSASATLTIDPPGNVTLTGISVSPTSVVGGTPSTGTVTLSGNAPSGGVIVTLSSNSVDATVPPNVMVAAGYSTAPFTVTTTAVATSTSTLITGTLGSSTASATLTVVPPTVTSLSFSPNPVVGGNQVTGTATLNGPAPTGGIVVSITSSSAYAQPPTSVTIAAGATSVNFTINTTNPQSATTATITGTQGTTSVSGQLTINPAAVTLTGVSLSPTTVLGGSSSTGTVTLSGPAPTGGIVVTLASSYSKAAVPSTVTVPTGASMGTFLVTTSGVQSNSTATITATFNGSSQTAVLTIDAPTLLSVTISPASVVGGSKATGTVTLSGPAATGGVGISLSSNSTNATVQSTVTVAAGATTAIFSINTTAVGSSVIATITANHASVSQTATLTINPATLSGLSLAPSSLIGGAASTGTVALNGPAPAGGLVVSLSSNNSNATAPASVTVASGATTATFTVTTAAVSAVTSATITGTLNSVSLTATLTINPSTVAGVALNPTSVIGGSSSTGTVTLTGPAPTSGAVVTLSSSNATYAAVPVSVTVAGGATSATFTVTTTADQSTKTAVITAGLNSSSKTATLTITAPALASVTLSPATLVGGGKTTGTVTLTGPAATGGVGISLSSNSTNAPVQTSVTVPAGATSATFVISSTVVTSAVTATITATHGTVTETATLAINPYQVTAITANPTAIVGGDTAEGTVTLNAAAPTGGVAVSLSSNSTSAGVPATVTVPAGASSVSFSITTTPVLTATNPTIQASIGSNSTSPVTVGVTVNPPTILAVAFSPQSVAAGQSTTLLVLLSGPTAAGATLNVTCNSTRLTVGSTLTCVAGEFYQTFTLPTTPGPNTTVNVTISYNGTSDSDVLTITS